jgi:hypothetical protein
MGDLSKLRVDKQAFKDARKRLKGLARRTGDEFGGCSGAATR